MAPRPVYGDLIPKAGARPMGVAGVLPPIEDLDREFVRAVAVDPDVQDWLISCSELEKTRREYLSCLAMCLQWAHWTPGHLLDLKHEALKAGEPRSPVETMIKRYHEALRQADYEGLTRAKMIAAVYSFIGSKGYPIPKKLVRFDSSPALEMRVPTREEVQIFIQYARDLETKLLYTMMTDTPCRPRVFPALRWNWLEEDWSRLDVVHVPLPKEFRPGGQGGPRKFEPICFLGQRSIELLKQVRHARIKKGHTPEDSDRILSSTYDAILMTIRRDYERHAANGLIRTSRTDPAGSPLEQPITPKSWRKYQFNLIDALSDVSPEWRKMLKGRDLETERYYSQENIEELRKIYREKIYPRLWIDLSAGPSAEEVKSLRQELDELKTKMSLLEGVSGLRIRPQEVIAK